MINRDWITGGWIVICFGWLIWHLIDDRRKADQLERYLLSQRVTQKGPSRSPSLESP